MSVGATIRAMILGATALVGSATAQAQTQPSTQPPEPIPGVITSDELIYDQDLGLYIARGNVEILYDERILRADVVTYNERSDVVTATGNVVLVDPSGEVYFAEYAELQDELRDGFVEELGVRLTDNSRIAGRSASRADGRVTTIDRAVYSPCDLCEEDPEQAPVWQVRASQVTHDNETKDIVYRNAVIDLFGVPVIYTPYLSMPDPTVRQRSGFLPPVFGGTGTIGAFVRQSYYWGIAPYQDATFTVMPTADSGILVGGEYRRRWEAASLEADLSYNNSSFFEETGTGRIKRSNRDRWHIFADGSYDVDRNWRLRGQIRRSSDDSYARSFLIDDSDVLTSNLTAEGFYGLDYVSADLFAFQDTREDAIDQPLVAPWVRYQHLSDPGSVWGGQTFGELSTLALVRTDADVTLGNPLSTSDVTRFSGEFGWQRTWYSDMGLVSDFSASMASGAWFFSEVPTGPAEGNGIGLRADPRATLELRYPLARRVGTLQQLIEPIFAVTAAGELQDSDIPNNDSRSTEVDDVNLFSDNRLPGLDRVESGARATYGVRVGVFGDQGGESSVFLGQSVSSDTTSEFDDFSGLDRQKSDLVGRIRVAPAQFLDLDYSFRLDEDTGEFGRQELSAVVGPQDLSLAVDYVFAEGTPTGGDLNQLATTVSARFDEFWTGSVAQRYDFEAERFNSLQAGFRYEDECFIFDITAARTFSTDPNTADGVSVFGIVSLKTLADIPLPSVGL